MASQVQICNLALSRLGANTITSLSDNTTEAKLCNTFFSDIADEVMAEGSWTSTIRRATLAKTTTTPAFGFDSEFQLPVDPKALKILNIDNNKHGHCQYRIEGDKLLSNDDNVKIRYIARLVDTEDWDIYLQRAFIARLTSELAYPLTGDDRKASGEFQRYEHMLSRGLAQNGQQGSNERTISSDAINVRY